MAEWAALDFNDVPNSTPVTFTMNGLQGWCFDVSGDTYLETVFWVVTKSPMLLCCWWGFLRGRQPPPPQLYPAVLFNTKVVRTAGSMSCHHVHRHQGA